MVVEIILKSGSKMGILVSHNYRARTRWWSDKCANTVSSSSFWKGIMYIKDIFLATAKKVKNGRATNSGKISSVPMYPGDHFFLSFI